MFYLNKNTELSSLLLQKMLNKFYVEVVPQLTKYKNYYDGLQAIGKKTYNDKTKPCSRICVNMVKNIVDTYCGYLATPSYISYSSENDIEEIMNVLRYNDYQAQDAEFLLNALIYGVAAELMYNDEDGHTRFKNISPDTCFGVFDDSLTNDLIYFVRIYKQNDWDDTDIYNLDVYNELTVKHYQMSGKQGFPILLSEEPHYFSQCPANVFALPDEKSIFDCILSLQDAYNEILSSEADEYNDFCDSYLTFSGVDAEKDDIAAMKENRVLMLPDGANAAWLVKGGSDTQVENMLTRIQDSIYRIAACPDLSSETFVGGVSSGIAIKYRLTGIETRAGKIEAEMKKALQRRVEIIAGIASLKLGEEVFRDINIDFKRNIPNDEISTINLVNSLKGVVSDATLLSQLDFVDDVNKELEAIQKQKQENMALYSFTPINDEEDDEE